MVAGVTQDAPTGQTLRVRLLGEFGITAGERRAGPWPRPSARRLCALLLVTPGRRVTRDLACEELFPRLEPKAAARSLSKALSMARTALAELGEPGTALLGGDLTHLWIAREVAVDADIQSDALRDGLAMPPGQEKDDVLAHALTADGELLPDEPYADWAELARDRLNSLRQEARLVLARDRSKGAGRSGSRDVTAAWLACLDHDPACEEAAGALIRGYLAQGRPEQAARVFERCRAALEELGLRISPSLERIYRSATAARAPISQPSPAPSGTESPSRQDQNQLPERVRLTPDSQTALQAAENAVATQSQAVAPPVPAVPVWPPREERRQVTVLFAEVTAPAGLAGTLGLEGLRDLVGGSLATVIAEVEALGGMVTSVSGRGLQAMFGAPETHEDDPERAVRAAYRAISAAMAAASATVPTSTVPTSTVPTSTVPTAKGAAEPLGLRIGVESGPAVVGPIGDGAKVEYAAFGDVVSIAAALQSAARPGSVLVGPATRAAIAHLFSWGAAEELTLAADAKPLSAAYLDAPLAMAADRRPRLGAAPLVGRQAELRTLDVALRDTLAGRGHVILLTGQPGIGKTRLVQESRKRFIAWVGAGTARRPLWLWGRGVSYASATPYGLYRQLIAGWIGVALDQPPARIRAALADALTRLFGNTNLLAPLASLMGLPQQGQQAAPGRISPEELQRQTFAAVRALVTRFAAVAPTVLALEDLHWADPTSLRLTAELAELAGDRPLLVIATTRPGPHVLPLAREILLRPLAADAAEALATSLVGKLGGPPVLAAVLANADGNPLFLEERLAEMLEAGTLVREQGIWRLREPASPPLPQLLERLVRARVDRLTPPAVSAIRAAAVLGAEFSDRLLAATLGVPTDSLAPLLAELTQSELVHHAERSRSVFFFRHALIREATYLALLRAERRDLHARAARAIEAVAADRLPEVAAILGRHYATAEDTDRAVHYLELAGGQATDAFANDEAIASFREALAMTERAGDEMAEDAVRLHAKLANVLWRIWRNDEARVAFQAALRLAGAGPRPLDPVLRAHLHTRLGRLGLSDSRYEEAAADFDAAEALLRADSDCADESGADLTDAATEQWLELMIDGRASLHLWRSEPDLARAELERARPVLEARGTPARKTAFYRFWTMQKLFRNRLDVDDEDIANLRSAVAAAEDTGEDRDKDVGYATEFLGWVLFLHGDLDAAAEELTNALALADRIGETLLRGVALSSLTLTAMRRHDTRAVRALLPRAFEASSHISAKYRGHRLRNMSVAAWLAWQDDRPDEVLRLVADIEALDLTNMGSDAMHDWIYLFPLLAVHVAAGASAEAAGTARRIIDPSQQLLPDDLTTALAVACESWDQGDAAGVTRQLSAALALAREHAYF